jgi:hypothetical protein
MRSRFSSMGRFTTVLVLAGAIVAGTFAFTAANTVPGTHAGDGSGVVSGYTVTNVHYNLNANPVTIDSVAFTVDAIPPAGSTMKVQLVPAGTWYDCTNAAAVLTCTTTGQTVVPVTTLRVVIAD